MKVGIIGSGNMAVSLIKGFRTEKKNKIICSDIDIKKLIICFAIILAPIFFIIKQPDLGTSLIILLCGLITIFLGGIKKKQMIILFGLFSIAIPIMWKFILLPYQKKRIMTLFDPTLDPLGLSLIHISEPTRPY